VVGENGAFYFCFSGGRLHKRFLDDAAARAYKRSRLDAIARRILAEVPGCALSADQAYRETDLAIDYCEDVPPLPLDAAERIAALMEQAGLQAKISSIHVNGWFGGYDKLSTTRQMMKEDFDIDLDRDREMFVFAGDSPNDQPMFAYFPNAVGVANVLQMADLMSDFPKWITPSAGAAGFAELADALIPTK
jgi:hydroxymethylpyrimidine pyrophosphatase-like HAD family hydrolase